MEKPSHGLVAEVLTPHAGTLLGGRRPPPQRTKGELEQMRREMQTAQLIAEFPLTPEAVKVAAERAPAPDAAKAPAADHSAATTPFRPRYRRAPVANSAGEGMVR